ncbi:MAG: flotillin family protein [Verrucomicrobia bacterium]|nr:flotillin family protein [Verrucomicrobiota bacterium]MBT7064692.1 flotillin family protein [Verrucomicrobiota bacterium]MBT7700186.1 flotillin family protein [Verrucomicrobiota bacterium]
MLPIVIAQAGRSAKSGAPVALVLAMILAAAVIILFISFARRYKRCPSNRILVIYGKTNAGAARCIHGGAAFVWPLIQAYDYLDLEPFVVPIDLKNALSFENIRVTVPTTVTAAVSTTTGIMQNAAIRLLGLTSKEIQDQAQDIILGQMRAVIATMKIEEINADRQAFLAKVNDAVSGELEKIGLSLINVNIRDIEDESGYIVALGRRAAAEAINQANVDVAEQEKTGKTGVAERNRDQRVAVAAANADAEIGEALADKDRRTRSAALDAQAVSGETEADSEKAAFRANQSVAEEEARNRAESAAREADGAIRVAQEVAEKMAEEARSEREQARLNAEIVVPANADREKVVIAADAQKQKAVRIAEGEAQATLARMTAEGKGVQAILDGKAEGYQRLVQSCASAEQAASLLLIEKLQEIARIQAQAIQDLPIDKIFVWDTGGENQGMSGLGQRMMGALPPMHELAKQIGLDLPEYLGKTASNDAPVDEPPTA